MTANVPRSRHGLRIGIVALAPMTALLALLALAALAAPAAAEYYEGKPECPPDQMCTMSEEEPQPYGPDDCIECSGPVGPDGHANATDGNGDRCTDCVEPTRPGEDCVDDQPCPRGGEQPSDDGPTYGDCGAEVCAYDSHNDTPVSNDTQTCMDGADPGEDCRDDVQYLDGAGGDGVGSGADDGREPAVGDGVRESHAGTGADDDARTVPGAGGLALLAVGLGAVALGLAGRRRGA